MSNGLASRIVKKTLRTSTRLSLLPFSRSPHGITRYQMYQRLSEALAGKVPAGRVLTISGSTRLIHALDLPHNEIVEADYPEYNMLKLPFRDEEFDLVVSDQVLEHIEGPPQQAIDETHRVLRPGGLVIHTTCFMNPRHGCPSDFWRFSPNGLEILCSRFSRVLETGAWGNPYVYLFIWLGMRSEPVPLARWHPYHWLAVHSDPDWLLHTWIVAQK